MTTSSLPQHILIVEDKPDLNLWLQELSHKAFPDSTLDIAKNFSEGEALIKANPYHLALIDLGLPDGDGTDLIALLSQSQQQCQSIVMSIFDDSDHLFNALKAGAFGYLLKDENEDELLLNLNGIVEGKPPISPRMATRLLQYFREQNQPLESNLSERESEVLTLISKGYSVKKSAELLSISPYTVANHIKQIYKKLNINSRAEATAKAIELGLTTSSST